MILDEDLEMIKKKKLEEMTKKFNEPEVAFPEVPIVLTDGSLEAEVAKYPLLILDCWAEWCGPCKIIGPVIEELARDYKGRVVFGKLNVDENGRTARRYSIMAIPTLLVFKNGKLVDQMVGAYPKSTLDNKIQKYL
ncbi:MAG: thioredoxin [Euryarchaeota archaeon]|nr:thioredoxin [Euryarchaeota archaeon]